MHGELVCPLLLLVRRKAEKQLLCLFPQIFVDLRHYARAKGCRQPTSFGRRSRSGEVPGGYCQIRLEDLVQIVFARAEVRHDLIHLQCDRSAIKAAPYCFPDSSCIHPQLEVSFLFWVKPFFPIEAICSLTSEIFNGS